MDTTSWYRSLNKPTWAPQEGVFGTVWSILYPIIFAVNIYIITLYIKGKIGLNIALPFWLNLFFNLIFTPLQFGLKNNLLAMLDIYFILLTIVWAIVMIWSVSKIAALAFVPYLVWVAIATVLQTYIALNN
jgi:translocator protein